MLLFILLSLNVWLYSWTHWPSTGFKESPFKNRFITRYDTIFRLDWLGQLGKWRFILYCWLVLRKLSGTIMENSLENSLETHTLSANTHWLSLQELIDSGTKSKCHISSKTFPLEDNVFNSMYTEKKVQLQTSEHSVDYVQPTWVRGLGIFVGNMGIHLRDKPLLF